MQGTKDNACDNCRKPRSELFLCIVCHTTTCSQCHAATHVKQESKHHKRVLKKLNVFDYKYSYEMPVTFFSADFYRLQTFGKDSLVQAVLESAHRVLFSSTHNGNPMLLLKDLSVEVAAELGAPQARVVDVLESDFRCSTLHKTTRSFGDFITLKYFSLCLTTVSVESIVWILKSIRNDLMQPNESLMFSRFKEYFAIKIAMKEWKRLIEGLVKSKELITHFNQYRDVFGELEIREIEEGSFLFLLRGVSWVYEDLSEVRDSDLDYQAFLAYIDEFFTDETLDTDKEAERRKWLSSVESSKKRSTILSMESNTKKFMQSESISKAIPGGKYGCTLLIKNCGTLLLKQLSIGRIYALIKHGLNNQVISHLKTHIVKNEPKVAPLTQNRDQQILDLQQYVLELLAEQDSVTLAQLPLLLQKKTHKFYNFQELGFIKLKNFLMTLEDKIELTRSSNNHIKVSLRRKKDPPYSQGGSPCRALQPPSKRLEALSAHEKLPRVHFSKISPMEPEDKDPKDLPRPGHRDPTGSRDQWDPRDKRDHRDPRDQKDNLETRDQRDPREQWDGREPGDRRLRNQYLFFDTDRPERHKDPEIPKSFDFKPQLFEGDFLNMSEHKRVSIKKAVPTPSQESDRSREAFSFLPSGENSMSASQFCKQFESIKNFILGKLRLCRFGLELNKVEKELSEFLGHPFRPRMFKCETFHQFLQENFPGELEINLKRTVKSKVKKTATNPEYMIYPKSGPGTYIPSNNDSLDSINRSGNSGKPTYFLDNPLNSDTSQGNAKTWLVQEGSNSENSNQRFPVAFPRQNSSNWSNRGDEDDLERIFWDEDQYPLYTKNDSRGEDNIKDLDILEDHEIEQKVSANEKRFINYIYEN